MYNTRSCTTKDRDELIKIIRQHKFYWGTPMDEDMYNGFSYQIAMGLSFPQYSNIVCATENNRILGYVLQTFRPGDRMWYYKQAFHIPELAGNADLTGAIWDGLFDEAERRGIYECFTVSRGTGNREHPFGLKLFASSRYFREKYVIDPVEVLLPGTMSSSNFVNGYVLGPMAGRNAKPLTVRHAHLKELPTTTWSALRESNPHL